MDPDLATKNCDLFCIASGDYSTNEFKLSTEMESTDITKTRGATPFRKSWLGKRGVRSKSHQRGLLWSVKRNELNKAIYKHKEKKMVECPKKLELDVGHGSSHNPKISLALHPYGLERDKQRYVTLEVRIDVSKKAPKLSSSAKVRFSVSAADGDENKQLNECVVEKDILLREFYVHEFISHEALRESRSKVIEIKALIEYMPCSVLD